MTTFVLLVPVPIVFCLLLATRPKTEKVRKRKFSYSSFHSTHTPRRELQSEEITRAFGFDFIRCLFSGKYELWELKKMVVVLLGIVLWFLFLWRAFVCIELNEYTSLEANIVTFSLGFWWWYYWSKSLDESFRWRKMPRNFWLSW